MSRRARAGRTAPASSLEADLALLGLTFPGLKASSHEHARELLAAWKLDTLRPAWRRTAKLTHPDRNPDDPSARKRFERSRAAYERLDRIEVPAPRARVQARRDLDPELVAELVRRGVARMGRPRGGRRGTSQSFTVTFTSAFDEA